MNTLNNLGIARIGVGALLLALCLLNSLPTYGQFTGGSGDGFSQRIVVQLSIDGVPAGVAALYLGGPGDGFDREVSSYTVSGADLSSLYAGSSGDGFDARTVNLTISGEDLSEIYLGGDGDGFDARTVNLTISGEDLSEIYLGGDGDGFDARTVNVTISGEDLSGIYLGGDGDGFDARTINLTISGEDLSGIYLGGDGDGFDQSTVQLVLSGESLAQLFGGGEGDGFDAQTYFGVLPLPLTLISFDAFPEDKYVLLRWVTEDEVATDYFTIEKTRNGSSFATVGTTPAAGDSEPGERIHYELRDEQPYDGTSFYRLQTTDFDGAISLSHLVEVNYASAEGWDFQFFPNPNTGRQVSLRPVGVEEGTDLKLEILDVQGRALLKDRMTTNGTAHRFELNTPLPAGSYLIRVTDNKGQGKAKILIVQ